MSSTKISPKMSLKLKQILYDYEEHTDLNESSRDHLVTLQYFICYNKFHQDLQFYEIAQYKNELLIILDFHQENIGSFPKNTYTIIRKATNAIQFNNGFY